MSEENGADVGLKIAGQEINVKNVKSLNTGLTLATFVVCVCGFVTAYTTWDAYAKGNEKKEGALVTALNKVGDKLDEQVKQQRLMNCLLSMDQKDRRAAYDQCERIAR